MTRIRTGARLGAVTAVLALLFPALVACGSGDELVIYSGRMEPLIADLLDQLEEEVGVEVEVRYASSAELASLLLDEGEGTNADLFLSQDAGALGALTEKGMLATLPQDVLGKVDERFQAKDGAWVATSARARVIGYDPAKVKEKDLPQSVDDVVDPKWKGKVAFAPTNASWQSFVTGLRVLKGDDEARKWLEAFKANDPQPYNNNIAILDAVNAGEIELGLINHYYWFEKVAEDGAAAVNAKLHYVGGDDPLALVNVAGVGVIKSTEKAEQARKAVEFLLSETAQRYFADRTAEYPVIDGITSKHDLPPLSELDSPELDLTDLSSLDETTKMLQEVGLS